MSVGVVNIRGKEYQTVPLRVAMFRQMYNHWTIATHIIDNNENRVVIKAEIADDKGRLIATGYAEEFRKASAINKTSALENAETSAVGRALAFLGLAGDGSIASAEEVQNAMALQEEGFEPGKLDSERFDYEELLAYLNADRQAFEAYYFELSDQDKIDLANCAPQGKKTEFKNAIREVEKEFHQRMDALQDEVTGCVLEGQPDALLEVLDELSDWEKPYLWSRLTDQEKTFIRNAKESTNG